MWARALPQQGERGRLKGQGLVSGGSNVYGRQASGIQQGSNSLISQGVKDVHPVASVGDEASLPQAGEMLRDVGLSLTEDVF